jgi:hypothetical protein
MKFASYCFFHVCFCLLILQGLRAQKTEKGSSADNPWNKEIHDDGSRFIYNTAIHHISSLSFGDWKFESKFLSPVIKSKITNADAGIFEKYLYNDQYNNRNALLVY